jgi:hypothetical protein
MQEKEEKMIVGIEYGLTLDLQEAAPPWPLEVGLERQHTRVPDTPSTSVRFPQSRPLPL